ncbi:MAG: hypothetical protein ACRD2G_06625 [Terriglobia bacterium]
MRKSNAFIVAVMAIGFARMACASGHGPVFAIATPTNVKGGWSLDLGTMDRIGTPDSGSMARAMLSYGITPDIQLSVSGPAVFSAAPLAPGRVTAMMPATGDFEAIGAWRFQRRDFAVGSRIETTAYGGVILPGSQKPPGLIGQLHWAPGELAMIATGYVSRKNYLWAGIGGMHFDKSRNDERPEMLMWSLAYAYRPKPFRKNYPHWDGRFFIEANGEYSDRVLHNGLSVPGTNGGRVFVGPSTLWIYKNYGIEAGNQFPVYRHTGPRFERERYRIAIDFSYFF